MSFKFTQSDDFVSLDVAIRNHLPKVIKNRIKEFEDFRLSFMAKDFGEIAHYCHKVRGVAACYGLYKLEEIVEYIHKAAKESDSSKIDDAFPKLNAYFESLK